MFGKPGASSRRAQHLFLTKRGERRGISVQIVIFLCAALYATILNLGFYNHILSFDDLPDDVLYTLPLLIFLFLTFCFELLALPLVHRLLMPLLFVLSSMVSYFVFSIDMYFTTNMFENVLLTNQYELTQMLSLPYFLWIAVLGLLPAAVYLLLRVRFAPFRRELLVRLGVIIVCLAGVGGIARFMYLDYASFFRNHSKVHFMIVPYNFIASGIGVIRRSFASSQPYVTLGEGLERHRRGSTRKVVVLILGETTRAMNFGLNGYSRQTTPELARRGDLIYVRDVRSCGTSTAVSVPCILSDLSSRDYYHKALRSRDSVLQVLEHSGVKVSWLDNNSSCQGACRGITESTYLDRQDKELCTDGRCLDEIMLPEFESLLSDPNDHADRLIVLHVMGNHGPSYFERYPQQFRRWTPTCDTNEISNCSQEEIVNSYDNAILYQDHFMNRVLEILSQHPEYDSACLFVSDHGESLGEKGLFLHGAPMAIAPDEQKLVPLFLWYSEAWRRHENTDLSCMRERTEQMEVSHDSVFSTLLGMLETATDQPFYKQDLDLDAVCRIR